MKPNRPSARPITRLRWHTLAMVRLRSTVVIPVVIPVVIAAVIVAVVLGNTALSGWVPVSTDSGAAHFSARERASIRTAILDSKWSQVVGEYPEAIRPTVTMALTVPDHEWASVMVQCLKSGGISAYIVNGSPTYGSAGQTPLEVAVRYYLCEAGHPSESQVASHFSPAQAAALYDYYLRVVRPCLLSAGAPSPASPDRSAVASLAGLAGWNPYQVIWTSSMSARTETYLEQRCPPIPAWLNLEP